MTLARSAKTGPSGSVVAAICAGEILGLLGYSFVPALLPQFIEAWSLTNTQAGWLAGMTSAGYLLAVIPLVTLTDRRPARQLYLVSSVLSALSCFGMALCDSLLPALGSRALGGIAMAGMYMPGLRALTHGVEGATRARIAAWYTSSFTIGASLSFLFGRVGTLLGWRSAFVIAGMLGAAGALTAWAALPRGDPTREEEPLPRLDFRPVLANRQILALIVGYAAAIWGCVPPVIGTIRYYNEMAQQNGGLRDAQKFSRLYLIPNMGHCAGGPATDQFDLLSPLVAWAENSYDPDPIIASGTNFTSLPTTRNRPLCPYPEEARLHRTPAAGRRSRQCGQL